VQGHGHVAETCSLMRVQEVHYNQHGLVLLAGQGIYRLADRWCADCLPSQSVIGNVMLEWLTSPNHLAC